jgi:hypothetical protein
MGEGTRTREDQYPRKDMYIDIFSEVVNVDQLKWYECKTMKGTRGFHSVRTSDNTIVEISMRKLSFFCGPCSSNEWDDCEYTYDLIDGIMYHSPSVNV